MAPQSKRPAGGGGDHGGHGGAADAVDALGDEGGAGEQRAGGAGGHHGVAAAVFQQRQAYAHGRVLFPAEYGGRVVAHLHRLRCGDNGRAVRQVRQAAGLDSVQNGGLVAGEHDVRAEALLRLQRALDDLQRGVVAAHGVYNDLHVYSTSCSMVWFRMSRERWLSSAFLLRLPLTRWSSGGMMPKLMFMGWKSPTEPLLT